MMCSERDELLARAGWEGKGNKSRVTVMDKLQEFLPPTIMLPPKRSVLIFDIIVSNFLVCNMNKNMHTSVDV